MQSIYNLGFLFTHHQLPFFSSFGLQLLEHGSPLHSYHLILTLESIEIHAHSITNSSKLASSPPPQGSEVLASSPYTEEVKITLHSSKPTSFTIQIPSAGTANMVCRTLIAKSRRDRDMIALVLRHFRAKSLGGKEVEDDLEELELTPRAERSSSQGLSTLVLLCAHCCYVILSPPLL